MMCAPRSHVILYTLVLIGWGVGTLFSSLTHAPEMITMARLRDDYVAAWQLWFVAVPNVIVGVLYLGAGVFIIRRPRSAPHVTMVVLVCTGIVAATQSLWALWSRYHLTDRAMRPVLTATQVRDSIVAIISACAPFIAVLAYLLYSRRRGLAEGTNNTVACANCGYLLRGLGEPRCPECGVEFCSCCEQEGNRCVNRS
jgi:hypothetical protein